MNQQKYKEYVDFYLALDLAVSATEGKNREYKDEKLPLKSRMQKCLPIDQMKQKYLDLLTLPNGDKNNFGWLYGGAMVCLDAYDKYTL